MKKVILFSRLWSIINRTEIWNLSLLCAPTHKYVFIGHKRPEIRNNASLPLYSPENASFSQVSCCTTMSLSPSRSQRARLPN